MLSTYFSKATYINSTHSLSNENRIFHIRIIQFNRSKGAQGPDEWVPPSGQCGYVANRTCLTALVLAKGRVVRVFQAR